MVIDAHHHFWTYSREEYDWIDESMSAIARDFGPADLAAEAAAAGVDGVVSVQARQTLDETRWLLSLADQHDLVRGVVGWAPLADASISDVLSELAPHPKLKSLRHVVQGEPDGFLDGKAFNLGMGLLERHGLAYDILIVERQLPAAIAFVDRHPSTRFVVDHIAKPRIKAGEVEPWASNLKLLAERPNTCCKLSGVVTEADFAAWTPASIRPFLDATLEAFGPSRLMFGSDWPVCLVASGYKQWLEVVQEWAAALSPDEQADLFANTAQRAYQL